MCMKIFKKKNGAWKVVGFVGLTTWQDIKKDNISPFLYIKKKRDNI